MTWQANWIKSQAHFANANRVLEVGAGAFVTSKYLAIQFPDKHFYGLDFTLSKAALEAVADIPSNLTIIKHDARDLKLLAEGYFEIAFSVAVLEHIRELAAHLDEVHRILTMGGRYIYWQAPYWSSSIGHHYRHWEASCPIPHYAHLHLSRAELASIIPEVSRANAMYYIYERGDLSRLSLTETRTIVRASRFRIENWENDPDQNYSAEANTRVLANNIYDVLPSDLKIKGSRVTLLKT